MTDFASKHPLGAKFLLLPLPVARQAVMQAIERSQAAPWVTENILFLKKRMEDERVAGNPAQMQRLLERFGPNYDKVAEGKDKNRNLGLTVGKTEKFFGRYNTADLAELKPLRESFAKYATQINLMEGRGELAGKPSLKEDDFWKLFFDGSEPFSLGGASKYAARPWPPTVPLGSATQLSMAMNDPNAPFSGMSESARLELMQMSRNRDANRPTSFSLIAHAERPFLIWKTEEQAGEVPEKLADVKDKVAESWKFRQARESKALPYAKKLAENLLKGNADYGTALAQAGKEIKSDLILLPGVAPLARMSHHGAGLYGTYQLHGEIKHPRDDTVEQVLALHDLKDPIKIGVPELDAVNEVLYREAASAKRGPEKYIQILTNKPRDTFFVAVIEGSFPASGAVFRQQILEGAAKGSDSLFDRAQVKRGEEHYRLLVEQLNRIHKVKREAAAEKLDTDTGS